MPDIPLAEEALRRVLAVVDRTAELATELATTLRMRPNDAAVRTAAIPLGVDVLAFGPAEFEAVARHLELLDQLIAAVPPDADGMRWRYLDEAVLFRCEAEVSTPFDEFTARVDISRVIGLTSGYLAGRTEVLARDATGRPIRQLERSISRAQPAYLALAGADVLDVCKLESIDYGPDEQVLRWRQVHSANGSAVQDDGSVSFARTPGGGTGVTVCAHQQFALPHCGGRSPPCCGPRSGALWWRTPTASPSAPPCTPSPHAGRAAPNRSRRRPPVPPPRSGTPSPAWPSR